MLDGEIDTDIKTVADRDLPKPDDAEKVAVRILKKKSEAKVEEAKDTPKIASKKRSAKVNKVVKKSAQKSTKTKVKTKDNKKTAINIKEQK